MFGLDDVIAQGLKIVDKFIPDANAREKAKEEMAAAIQGGVQKLLEGQIEINKAEAQSPSLFIAGWRPAVGWVCVSALFFYYVPYMIVVTGLWVWQVVLLLKDGTLVMSQLPPRPDLGIVDLLGLLGTLLGVGTMRTVEKVQGVETAAVTAPAGGLMGFVKNLAR